MDVHSTLLSLLLLLLLEMVVMIMLVIWSNGHASPSSHNIYNVSESACMML